jgi:hypothetical protein
MSNAEALWQRKNFVIRNSMFDIRYSFREDGKFIILELPTAEELAKHIPFFLPNSGTHAGTVEPFFVTPPMAARRHRRRYLKRIIAAQRKIAMHIVTFLWAISE